MVVTGNWNIIEVRRYSFPGKYWLIFLLGLFCIFSVESIGQEIDLQSDSQSLEAKLHRAIKTAIPGSTILLPAGVFKFKETIVLDRPLKLKGQASTEISNRYKKIIEIRADNVVLESIGLRDAAIAIQLLPDFDGMKNLRISNCRFSNIRYCSILVDKDNGGFQNSGTIISDCRFTNVADGIILRGASRAIIQNNHFRSLRRLKKRGRCTAIQVGHGGWHKETYPVADNVIGYNQIDTVYSATVLDETHAVLAYGDNNKIIGNNIKYFRSGSQNAEAIYTKARNRNFVVGNRILDYRAPRGQGVIAMKGGLGRAMEVAYNNIHAKNSVGIYASGQSLTIHNNEIRTDSTGIVTSAQGVNFSAGDSAFFRIEANTITSAFRCLQLAGHQHKIEVAGNYLTNSAGHDAIYIENAAEVVIEANPMIFSAANRLLVNRTRLPRLIIRDNPQMVLKGREELIYFRKPVENFVMDNNIVLNNRDSGRGKVMLRIKSHKAIVSGNQFSSRCAIPSMILLEDHPGNDSRISFHSNRYEISGIAAERLRTFIKISDAGASIDFIDNQFIAKNHADKIETCIKVVANLNNLQLENNSASDLISSGLQLLKGKRIEERNFDASSFSNLMRREMKVDRP